MKTKTTLTLVTLAFTLAIPFTVQAQPSENEIAEIVRTANDAEIDAAKTAESRANNPEVKDFAEHMIKEHEQNNKDVKKISSDTKISMKNSDASKTLKKDASSQLADIKKMKGAAFDKAYIDQQISMHQQLLTDLNNTYIPATSNADLKNFLMKTKDHVQEHLSQAEDIRAHITK